MSAPLEMSEHLEEHVAEAEGRGHPSRSLGYQDDVGCIHIPTRRDWICGDYVALWSGLDSMPSDG
jgi:hypothetical protein